MKYIALTLALLPSLSMAEESHCPELTCSEQNAQNVHQYITGQAKTLKTTVCPSTAPMS